MKYVGSILVPPIPSPHPLPPSHSIGCFFCGNILDTFILGESKIAFSSRDLKGYSFSVLIKFCSRPWLLVRNVFVMDCRALSEAIESVYGASLLNLAVLLIWWDAQWKFFSGVWRFPNEWERDSELHRKSFLNYTQKPAFISIFSCAPWSDMSRTVAA
jgi:hypothetical protein